MKFEQHSEKVRRVTVRTLAASGIALIVYGLGGPSEMDDAPRKAADIFANTFTRGLAQQGEAWQVTPPAAVTEAAPIGHETDSADGGYEDYAGPLGLLTLQIAGAIEIPAAFRRTRLKRDTRLMNYRRYVQPTLETHALNSEESLALMEIEQNYER